MNELTMEVIKFQKDVVFLRLPPELRQPLVGGCQCPYCAMNPQLKPMWDTLAVPIKEKRPHRPVFTYKLHMPFPDAV